MTSQRKLVQYMIQYDSLCINVFSAEGDSIKDPYLIQQVR